MDRRANGNPFSQDADFRRAAHERAAERSARLEPDEEHGRVGVWEAGPQVAEDPPAVAHTSARHDQARSIDRD
jgi:hypothetical protein